MLSLESTDQATLVKNLSILFVDDDADVRDSMARYLARRVNKVHVAQNGKEGLDSFMAHSPDMVISDIRMGVMDGLVMCRAIRETHPDIPVIFISAHNESEILLSSIDLGITKFIVKPVDTDELMSTINNVANALENQRNLKNQIHQMSLILDEADYVNECVKSYVSHYLESNRHEELSCVRHLSIPKLEVSGDFYSVVKHHDDLYVMLADGAGHGLSAVIPALQMPKMFQQQAEHGFSLLMIAAEINRSLHEQHITEHFVATSFLRINARERFIEVLNCSNPQVLVFNDAGELLHSCHSTSTALGMVNDDKFSAEVERFSIEHNARIYLFTDGLIDTLQESDPNFASDKLSDLFVCALPPQVFDAVSTKVSEIAARHKVDDVTLLEVRFDGDKPFEIQTEVAPEIKLACEVEMPVALDQMTLLYVEDDDLTREYLSLYLNRRLGMVYVAKDGQQGLALFKKYRPQIVLSDIKMPLMDGLEMAAEIRKLDAAVPIIVTSGSDRAEDAEKMFEMGVSRFHLKPLDTEKLGKTIQFCIRQANALNQLHLSASAFQASSLAVITADRSKHIVAINPAFSHLTGYSLNEVIGCNPTLLSSGKYDANHFQAMWQSLDESGSWSGELLCQYKNGETASEWLTANAVKGSDDELTGYHFIFSDNAEREKNEEKARYLALHDGLTHLPNRMEFANIVGDMLVLAKHEKRSLVLINIKIERFNDINNVLGVHAGDEVISVFAKRLLNSVAASDVVCRTGGVEFAVIMKETTGREAIEQEVCKLFREIAQPFNVLGQSLQLRASMGVSAYPNDGETYETLLRSANIALDDIRLSGGGKYRFFDYALSQRKERQVALQQGLKIGLQKGEFYMLYQPKYSLSRQRVVGAEALVRWNHPILGLISPTEFIPLAESNGSVIELSEWIIDTVCQQIAAWQKLGLRQIPVSINISPLHFWHGDLVKSLQASLNKWGVIPAMLPIEVTEGVVMDSSQRTLQVMGQLKALGFHLSIDDFGTGYSSLKYLMDLPISELKIDRSFVIEIPEAEEQCDLSRTAITRTIIQLASELNLTVVAEGVETENQKDFLLKNGCDVIQGYLFSRPIAADEFIVLLS